MSLRLGKTPARPGAVRLRLADYTDTALPRPPRTFGHEQAITGWGMLGNDRYGDCVWAGAAHETLLWNREAGRDVTFNDTAVLADYSAVTGFQPNDPATDQGTDMQAAASYRLKTGVQDASGTRHRIGAYLAITPGDLREHLTACWLFGAVGVGIEFPASAMDQFDRGQVWRPVRRSKIEGGHYVPLVAHRAGLVCVTWGRTQPMTAAFLARYNDESLAYVSEEMLTGGMSPEGFDAATLRADLAKLRSG